MFCDECDICKEIANKINQNENNIAAQSVGVSGNLNQPILLIVGEGPYPTNPVDEFAFCKPTWKEQVEYNCSGRFVLCSLGIDLQKAASKYSFPEELFQDLKKKGVLFENAFLSLNTDGSPSKRHRNKNLLSQLQSFPKIVLCGRETHFLQKEDGVKVFHSIHPAARCKNYCPLWNNFWGTPKNLLKILEPDGNGPIHNAIELVNT